MKTRSSVKAQWMFLERVLGSPYADGNITRLFNTGDSRPPACFGSIIDRNDVAALSAVIFGREGIANCFDASRARLQGSGTLGLDFRFGRHQGAASTRIWDLLGLDDLSDRIAEPGVTRSELGLGTDDCLASGPGADLRTLTVIERGGGGMPGALDHPDSVLARALISVGEAQSSVGAAGSYGYGKAAVAQASKVRVVVAYTCSTPVGIDRVTRRLVGVAYWGNHRVGTSQFTGWGLLGDRHGTTVAAHEDEAADTLAEALGLPVRRPGIADDLGTTFLLIDPAFDATMLKGAIELFWWPILQRTRPVELAVTITTEAGVVVTPDVGRDHPVLDQFIEAFHEAERTRESGEEVLEERRVVRSGQAGITSLAVRKPESPVNQSLVALMRSPLMVVGYSRTPSANPPVVGVFVSHDSTNEHLRRVEPPEHDKWQQQNVGGLNASKADLDMARTAKAEREQSVLALRAPDPEPVYGIDAFAKHFPAVDVKVAKPRPPRPTRNVKQRLVRVHLVHESGAELIEIERPTRSAESDGRLVASGEVKFFLDPERARRVKRRVLDATVTIGAAFAEDGSSKIEYWPANVEQRIRGDEEPFRQVSAPGEFPVRFEGRFTVGLPVFFQVRSDPYPSDWTLEMIFDCTPWDVVAPPQLEEDK